MCSWQNVVVLKYDGRRFGDLSEAPATPRFRQAKRTRADPLASLYRRADTLNNTINKPMSRQVTIWGD